MEKNSLVGAFPEIIPEVNSIASYVQKKPFFNSIFLLKGG